MELDPGPALPLSLSPQIPMVPLTPALSILLNVCLMLKLSYLTWLRFSIWLVIGEWQPGTSLGWAGLQVTEPVRVRRRARQGLWNL